MSETEIIKAIEAAEKQIYEKNRRARTEQELELDYLLSVYQRRLTAAAQGLGREWIGTFTGAQVEVLVFAYLNMQRLKHTETLITKFEKQKKRRRP